MKKPKKFEMRRSRPSFGDHERVEIECGFDRVVGYGPKPYAFIVTSGAYGDEFGLSPNKIDRMIEHLKQVKRWLQFQESKP